MLNRIKKFFVHLYRLLTRPPNKKSASTLSNSSHPPNIDWSELYSFAAYLSTAIPVIAYSNSPAEVGVTWIILVVVIVLRLLYYFVGGR